MTPFPGSRDCAPFFATYRIRSKTKFLRKRKPVKFGRGLAAVISESAPGPLLFQWEGGRSSLFRDFGSSQKTCVGNVHLIPENGRQDNARIPFAAHAAARRFPADASALFQFFISAGARGAKGVSECFLSRELTNLSASQKTERKQTCIQLDKIKPNAESSPHWRF